MNYYLIAVASSKYHGNATLTYSSEHKLKPGHIVSVPLQKQTALGLVVAITTKPNFAVRQILVSYTDLPPIPRTFLALQQWMLAYYPAPLGITTRLFLPKEFPKNLSVESAPSASLKPTTGAVALTTDQRQALSALGKPGSYLLHGETGTGKTRVYIEAARQQLGSGKSCIILTPEISLTSQVAQEFARTFGEDSLTILHSQLTIAQRRNIWLRLLTSTTPQIIIGPRSALFSPLETIGLIVIDESHEFAYKQENAPHYHAARVASKIAELHGAQLIMGSATPSISDYFVAAHKKRPVLRMQQLAATAETMAPTEVTVVDLRNKSLLTRDSHLSTPLLNQLEATLRNKQQSLIFINRRGTARVVLCDNCGWQALCPHCDLPLTYHHDSHSLRCHACSYSTAALSSCPTCGNADITLKSVGTKSIVASLEKIFPGARVERFDADNRKGERLNEVWKDIHSGKIDILVGTQLLAKGLDLPKLGLVGVINADASLYIPDFTAQERTYQLLYQLIGRVGRGHQANASAVIQTYSPDNTTLTAAINRDWDLFYKTELEERKHFLFPPFCHMLKLSCKRAKSAAALAAAEKFAAELRTSGLLILVEGPAPAFHEKIQNKYVWQLIVKAKDRGELLKAVELAPKDWSYDIDPIDLL